MYNQSSETMRILAYFGHFWVDCFENIFADGKSFLLLFLVVLQNLNVSDVLAWIAGQSGVVWSDDQIGVFVSWPVVIFVVQYTELVGHAKNGDAYDAQSEEEVRFLVKALADLILQLLPAKSKKQHFGEENSKLETNWKENG